MRCGEHLSAMAGCTNMRRVPYRPPQYRKMMLQLIVLRRLDCVLEPTNVTLNQTSSRRASRPYGRRGRGARVLQAYTHYYNETRIHRSLSKDAPAIARLSASASSLATIPLFITAIAESDFRYNSRGFAYATSLSATGEPPCNESSNARYRYFPRTPFFVAFELAGCQQLVAPRVAACEHLPRDLRFNDKRVRGH
jgi:HsdM N-terminal domain